MAHAQEAKPPPASTSCFLPTPIRRAWKRPSPLVLPLSRSSLSPPLPRSLPRRPTRPWKRRREPPRSPTPSRLPVLRGSSATVAYAFCTEPSEPGSPASSSASSSSTSATGDHHRRSPPSALPQGRRPALWIRRELLYLAPYFPCSITPRSHRPLRARALLAAGHVAVVATAVQARVRAPHRAQCSTRNP